MGGEGRRRRDREEGEGRKRESVEKEERVGWRRGGEGRGRRREKRDGEGEGGRKGKRERGGGRRGMEKGKEGWRRGRREEGGGGGLTCDQEEARGQLLEEHDPLPLVLAGQQNEHSAGRDGGAQLGWLGVLACAQLARHVLRWVEPWLHGETT